MAKRQSAITNGLVALGLLVVGCSKPPPQPTTEEGRPVADAFLKRLVEQKPDEAWEATSADFKSDEGRESFRQFVRARPILQQSLNFVSATAVIVNDVPRTEFTYRPGDPKRTERVKLIVAQEASAWKVERVLVE
jgi:hypothetical protein